ncbi:MAG: ATP-binding protein [Pseudomonadota bacterium]
MDAGFEALLKKLQVQPDNVTLRLAVMRRAMGAGMASRALELALSLEADAVANPDDRTLVAQVYRDAGLDDDAALWSEDASAAARDDDPPEGAGLRAVPEVPGASDDQVPPDGADDPDDGDAPARILRVVGGTEGDGAKVALPEPEEAPLTFADVGGLDTVKRDIERRIIAPFKQSSLLARFKKRAGGGVLLYGPPGCGKTLIARATAGECGFDFVSVSIADVLDQYSGNSEKRLTALFDKARHQKPSVLFFDEIDALGSKRTTASATHNAQLVSHFLAEMDGMGAKNDGVLVLAATNIPWSMDPAFLRPGRFDRLFFIPPPDRTAREAILALELGTRPTDADLGLARIAQQTSGLSGADLALIVEQAADMAIDATLDKGAEVPIDAHMLAEAAGAVRSSVTDWLTTARNHATYANESGRYDDILAFLKAHGRA